MMEWTRVQHLELRHVARGQKPQQPHYAAFKSSQAVVAVAVGTHLIEFDCLTGSKISSIDIGARVVRMSYSPTNVDSVIAILDVSLLNYLISICTHFYDLFVICISSNTWPAHPVSSPQIEGPP